jgi:hypothetical protein
MSEKREAKGDFWFRITENSFDPTTGDVGVYLEIFAYDTNPVAGFVPLKKARMLTRLFYNACELTQAAVDQRKVG